MQNINFRRWLKHLVKEYQRSNDTCFVVIQNKLLARGLLITNMNVIYDILEDSVDVRCKRLARLASRLGNVASRRDNVISLSELRTVLWAEQDPRTVPFQRLRKVVTTQHVVNYGFSPAHIKDTYKKFNKFLVMHTVDKLACNNFEKRKVEVEDMCVVDFIADRSK